MDSFVIRQIGDPRSPRYVIKDRSRLGKWHWTGRVWSQDLAKARLYADPDDVNRAIARLYADLLR